MFPHVEITFRVVRSKVRVTHANKFHENRARTAFKIDDFVQAVVPRVLDSRWSHGVDFAFAVVDARLGS